jgi:hypothetical protein
VFILNELSVYIIAGNRIRISAKRLFAGLANSEGPNTKKRQAAFRTPYVFVPKDAVFQKESSVQEKSGGLVWLQAIDVEFAANGRSCAAGDAAIIAARADIDLAVGDGGNGELHGEARNVGCNHGAVPEFGA